MKSSESNRSLTYFQLYLPCLRKPSLFILAVSIRLTLLPAFLLEDSLRVFSHTYPCPVTEGLSVEPVIPFRWHRVLLSRTTQLK